MAEHDTGEVCNLCKTGSIVAVVEPLDEPFSSSERIGPRHGPLRVTVSFHCSNCQIVYYRPPGRPNAASEILATLQREAEEAEHSAVRTAIEKRFAK